AEGGESALGPDGECFVEGVRGKNHWPIDESSQMSDLP
ncbi:SMARCA2 isoform 49, partial [Pan troglodytes]